MSNKKKKRKVAFILGAGFSKCAGIPIQADFSPLLTADSYNAPLDQVVTNIIKRFLNEVFGWKENTEIPSLEDIFTFIDLSVFNSSHLGKNYSPDMLRALRRMLIYRTFQIIDQQFKICEDILDILKYYKEDECSFIVMNWDIVLENHLSLVHPEESFNYIAPSYDWNNHSKGNKEEGIPICKMHGSSNWVYCENCKSLFYQFDKEISLHKKVGLRKSDFQLFKDKFSDLNTDSVLELMAVENCCKLCENLLSSHIATFSYRKSFTTAAYSAIWFEAENILAEADKWVLIGYSLPEADFEMKHLIKSAALRSPKQKRKREIEAVLFNDDYAKFKLERFFGPGGIRVYEDGLGEYVKTLRGQKD